jgi:hypothetical protein
VIGYVTAYPMQNALVSGGDSLWGFFALLRTVAPGFAGATETSNTIALI